VTPKGARDRIFQTSDGTERSLPSDVKLARQLPSAQHHLLTTDQKDGALVTSLALPPKPEARRQKVVADMAREIKAASDLFRPHTWRLVRPALLVASS
jgi:hypothetical protein